MRSTNILFVPFVLAAILLAPFPTSGAEINWDRALKKANEQVTSKPTANRQLGYALLKSTIKEGIALKAAFKLPTENENNLIDWRLWSMLPVRTENRTAFHKRLSELNDSNASPWISVMRLYDAHLKKDRNKMLAAARKIKKPTSFPLIAADQAMFDLLIEIGMPRNDAALHLLSNRQFDALYALRDLDYSLTREALFFKSTNKEANADVLIKTRNQLRIAYLDISQHLVPRLFALNLSERQSESKQLLHDAKQLTWLHNKTELSKRMKTLGSIGSWSLLLEPLLKSELAVIKKPPQLTQIEQPVQAQLKIRADKKTKDAKGVRYQGDVTISLGELNLQCDELTLTYQADKTASIKGREKVVASGEFGRVTANEVQFDTSADKITFSERVRLNSLTLENQKMAESLTLSMSGEVLEQKSLLDDFRAAEKIEERLSLLAKIEQEYDPDELPRDVEYLLAMKLLQPHLSWQIGHMKTPSRGGRFKCEISSYKQQRYRSDDPWEEAHSGESWMWQADQLRLLDLWKKYLAQIEKKLGDKSTPKRKDETFPLFWNLEDATYADVARAIALLEHVIDSQRRDLFILSINARDDLDRHQKQKEIGKIQQIKYNARDWLNELKRNNTVLTFDVLGGYPIGTELAKDADSKEEIIKESGKVKPTHWPVVMDVRGADKVAFRLYRVQKPSDLVAVTQRIGIDYLYRDYGLGEQHFPEPFESLHMTRCGVERIKYSERHLKTPPLPTFDLKNMVHQWEVNVGELDQVPDSRLHDDDYHDEYGDDPDSDYFRDDGWRFQERVSKQYRVSNFHPTTWQTDRIVRVPRESLNKAGAYVLIAEANGQRAHVPLIVEPLSLTLRRCRDGVFAMVSDDAGIEPIAGADVMALYQVDSTKTDETGAAFARIFATGSRTIVAHHNGRYAIGGFGNVFKGVYDPWSNWKKPGSSRMMHARELRVERLAQVYADEHVVAAYTDRPTYRPGQKVEFKLIARRLAREGDNEKSFARPFRALDFDATAKFSLLKTGTSVRYEIVNPKGRTISDGTLTLNDFGTTAGRIELNDEAMVGSYSMRVWLDGRPRIVPQVFQVKYYRRANFKLDVDYDSNRLTIDGHYYFGKPVASGRVHVRLVHSDHYKPLVEAKAKLDSSGRAIVTFAPPENLAAGEYHLITALTDESGRTVTDTQLHQVKKKKSHVPKLAMPRFVPVGRLITVPSSAKEVKLNGVLVKSENNGREHNRVTLTLTRIGWNELLADGEKTRVFAYGGTVHPYSSEIPKDAPPEEASGDSGDGEQPLIPNWVNLTNYNFQNGYSFYRTRWEKEDAELLALFDSHHATVGETVRVLLYVPHQKSRVLLTVEGRTVVDYHSSVVQGEHGYYHVVEVPIRKRCLPNVYLQGRIMAWKDDAIPERHQFGKEKRLEEKREMDDEAGEDPGWCRIDVIASKSNSQVAAEKLNVTVKTDQTEYRPGQKVNASIRVTDQAGMPQQSEVSLAAVDSSVFRFGEDRLDTLSQVFSDGNAERRFFPKTWRSYTAGQWSAKTLLARNPGEQLKHRIESMQKAIKQAVEALVDRQVALGSLSQRRLQTPKTILPAGEMPTTNIPLARLRTDFRETATWQPQLRTGPDGTLKTSFTLPDSLTSYRLSAVALTKETQVGVGRALIRATQPLNVQVFLPRFAVETDRLQAVGLIHNTTSKARTCRIAWQIKGARIDEKIPAKAETEKPSHDQPSNRWKVTRKGEQQIAVLELDIPANGSRRVGIWLAIETIGKLEAKLTAGDDEIADAEQRTLTVHALGRRREVTRSGTLTQPTSKISKDSSTSQHHRQRIVLPKGFIIDDLQISLARGKLARSLDSLQYLINYPNGCVEQTMSRFLPAVAVRKASKLAPVQLPESVAEKLPAVLERGLARLYNFQHDDGGWGWWEHDKTNLAMTVYVVDGLARCQAAGTPVDTEVLSAACLFLKKELAAGRLRDQSGELRHGTGRQQGGNLEARAWRALVLAGHAKREKLITYAQVQYDSGKLSAEVSCELALTCHSAGLAELAAQLWRLARPWKPKSSSQLALMLSGQLAFGEPLETCLDTAQQLLSRRHGHRWNSTQTTASAVVSLAELLRYGVANSNWNRILVTINGKSVENIVDAEALKKQIQNFNLSGHSLPTQNQKTTSPAQQAEMVIELEIDSQETKMPFVYSITATGTQRLDNAKPSGDNLTLLRSYSLIDAASKAPDATVVEIPKRLGDATPDERSPIVSVGEMIAVHLDITLISKQSYVMIDEPRPAGFEFVADSITTSENLKPANVEFRDDRIAIFAGSLPAGKHRVTYYLRAETPGLSHQLPGTIFPMYKESLRGDTGTNSLTIKND